MISHTVRIKADGEFIREQWARTEGTRT